MPHIENDRMARAGVTGHNMRYVNSGLYYLAVQTISKFHLLRRNIRREFKTPIVF
jgi:hypothetical protein